MNQVNDGFVLECRATAVWAELQERVLVGLHSDLTLCSNIRWDESNSVYGFDENTNV